MPDSIRCYVSERAIFEPFESGIRATAQKLAESGNFLCLCMFISGEANATISIPASPNKEKE